MLDPFPAAPKWLTALSEPISRKFNIPNLPFHVHEILLTVLFYTLVQTHFSPWLSTKLFPKIYPKFTARTKINWDVHVVSLVQSVLVIGVALWVMANDVERKGMTSLERIYGYTGACGLVNSMGLGYFAWDLVVSARYVKIFGWGVLAHAVSALTVYSQGLKPYLSYYGPTFILYELSSPFLNIHWFCDKVNLTGSRLQWYNGFLLLFTFAGCRLVWGTWQSLRFYIDIYTAITLPKTTSIASAVSARAIKSTSSSSPSVFGISEDNSSVCLGDRTCIAARAENLNYLARAVHMPIWIALAFVISNIVLNTLNFYWYGKMIKTVKSRFEGKEDPNADVDDTVEKVVSDGAEELKKTKQEEGRAAIKSTATEKEDVTELRQRGS